jgi:hypothetical protein
MTETPAPAANFIRTSPRRHEYKAQVGTIGYRLDKIPANAHTFDPDFPWLLRTYNIDRTGYWNYSDRASLATLEAAEAFINN